MVVGLPYTPYSRSVQTAPRCFVQKARYWALGLKGVVKASGACNGAECKWTTAYVSKGTKSGTKLLIFCCWQDKAVTGGCFTGYRFPGIEVAGTLHRRLYETWEAILSMRYKLQQEVSDYCHGSSSLLRLSLLPNPAIGRGCNKKRRMYP